MSRSQSQISGLWWQCVVWSGLTHGAARRRASGVERDTLCERLTPVPPSACIVPSVAISLIAGVTGLLCVAREPILHPSRTTERETPSKCHRCGGGVGGEGWSSSSESPQGTGTSFDDVYVAVHPGSSINKARAARRHNITEAKYSFSY